MYSIVIPTLWKSPRIQKLLFDLIECYNVDEIILIDNNNKFASQLFLQDTLVSWCGTYQPGSIQIISTEPIFSHPLSRFKFPHELLFKKMNESLQRLFPERNCRFCIYCRQLFTPQLLFFDWRGDIVVLKCGPKRTYCQLFPKSKRSNACQKFEYLCPINLMYCGDCTAARQLSKTSEESASSNFGFFVHFCPLTLLIVALLAQDNI